jgi:hypothetical protein
VITLFLYIVLAVCLGAGAVWLIGYLAPSHPAIIDKLIWLVVIIFVVLLVWTALGGHDLAVPRLGRL